MTQAQERRNGEQNQAMQANSLQLLMGGLTTQQQEMARVVTAAIDAQAQRLRDAGLNPDVMQEWAVRVGLRESGLDPNATSEIDPRTGRPFSTATGLGQFIERTWLGLAGQEGSPLNVALRAAGVTDFSEGNRAAILALRTNPQLNAVAIAQYAADNAHALQRNGHAVNGTNLYLSHFLGAAGADRFLDAMRANPSGSSHDAVGPGVVTANRSIFYVRGADGQERAATLQEVHANLARTFAPMMQRGLDVSARVTAANDTAREGPATTVATLSAPPVGAVGAADQRVLQHVAANDQRPAPGATQPLAPTA